MQSHPTVSPPREANRRMQVPRRALHTGSEVPCPVPGHAQVPALGHPLFCCFFVVWMFFFPSKFVGAGWCALPRRALPAEGARSPISPGGRPQPQSYLDVRHLRPRSLTPAWAWRRHSPLALAGPAGGTAAGKTPVGGRVAPDVTGVTDERRPPLRRPPRPCPALRGRLPGAQNRDAPRSPASAFGGPAPTLTPWGAPGLQ